MRPGATSWRCQIFSKSVVGSVMVVSAPPQAGGDDREEDRLARAGILEVVGKIGVERHAVALGQGMALAIDVEDDLALVDEGDLARAGLVARGIAGAPGRRARCEDVARQPHALAGLRRAEDLVGVTRRTALTP